MATKPTSGPRPVALLDIDPELGSGLSPADFAQARRYAMADTATVGRGVHEPRTIGDQRLLGLLIIDGLLVRTVQVAERRCGELVGPGAILRPWDQAGTYSPMPFEVRWRVIEPCSWRCWMRG